MNNSRLTVTDLIIYWTAYVIVGMIGLAVTGHSGPGFDDLVLIVVGVTFPLACATFHFHQRYLLSRSESSTAE